MTLNTKTLPEGSWILVVGATSFIASHIIQEFLRLGYKVRGTDHDESKTLWLTGELFKSYATNGSFEFVIVADIVAENALEYVIKDVSAVVYVASISPNPDPHNTIPQNNKAVLNALKTAAKEPSVSQFVMTSSLGAAFTPSANPNIRLDSSSWNDAAIDLAWAPPPYDPSRFPIVYMASKAEAERVLWKFVEEEKPHLTVNTVLPFWTCGQLLNKQQNLSSTMFIGFLYNGETSLLRTFETFSYVNVRDVALIHVAAVLDPDVMSQRIYAVAEHSNWNDILQIMRKNYPNRNFMEDLPDLGRFRGTVDNSLGLKLLRKWGNQSGWTSLEAGVQQCLDGM